MGDLVSGLITRTRSTSLLPPKLDFSCTRLTSESDTITPSSQAREADLDRQSGRYDGEETDQSGRSMGE